jgi:K+-transporting ATPase A subunit
MLAVEESLEQQMNISGKAMIFGAFATAAAAAVTTATTS